MGNDVYISKQNGRRVDPAIEHTLLAGPDYVSVTNTSKTLATLLGSALDTDITRVTLVPDSAGIFWADGTAEASSAPLPTGGIELNCRKAVMDTREFITASGTVKMFVIQEGLTDENT
jgi:hypothetical protein